MAGAICENELWDGVERKVFSNFWFLSKIRSTGVF